jgi:microcystin degradation protein MlrC
MLVVPQAMMTDRGAMKRLMDMAFEIENDPRVLNVTVAGGFPYSDIPDAGMTFVVTTDRDQALAEQYADALCELAVSLREEFRVLFVPAKEAVEMALAEPKGQVILAEGSDNVGGGGPGDATHVLKHLVGIAKPALIVISDREAAAHAFDVGVGGTFRCAVGGKHDRLHGEPVPIEGKVRLLSDGRYRHIGPYNTGKHVDLGRCAVVESGLLTILLTTNREGPWDIAHVSSNGIWPGNYHILVVKSAIAWQTAFGSFASKVIHVDTPGCCSANLQHFEYRKLRRPIYPLDPIHL